MGPGQEEAPVDISPHDTQTRRGGSRSLRTVGREWPLTWADAPLFLVAAIGASVALAAAGRLVGGPLEGSVGALDRRVARSLASERTAELDAATGWATHVGTLAVHVSLTVLVAAFLVWRWQRWREALVLVVALAFQAVCVVGVGLAVGSDLGASFPSPQTSAAAVSGAFAVAVFVRTSAWWLRVLAVALIVLAVPTAALATMYRGADTLSGSVAGALLGVLAVAVGLALVDHGCRRHLDRALEREFG